MPSVAFIASARRFACARRRFRRAASSSGRIFAISLNRLTARGRLVERVVEHGAGGRGKLQQQTLLARDAHVVRPRDECVMLRFGGMLRPIVRSRTRLEQRRKTLLQRLGLRGARGLLRLRNGRPARPSSPPAIGSLMTIFWGTAAFLVLFVLLRGHFQAKKLNKQTKKSTNKKNNKREDKSEKGQMQ